MGKEWTFTQRGGRRRFLALTGASAPHGRPRQGAVVSDGVELRFSRTYYPDGGGTPPTTHVFGTKWADWELKGRFSDVWLGAGGTKALIEQWQSFVSDAQEVDIAWGDVLSARGIVSKFHPERESEFECGYSLTVLIDDRNISSEASFFELPASPLSLCQGIQAELDGNVDVGPNLPNAGDLKPDFLDSLEESVSSLNGFSAALVNVAGEIDAFEDATFDQLERLRAGVVQMRTAVNVLRGTVAETENDSALLARAADTDVLWFAQRAALDVTTTRLLALLERLDREADIARRRQTLLIHLAQLGDTWESIATLFFGGPEDAGTIRDANGALYGQMPVPGRSYRIPLA